jgi:FKBP-type peptidyl-prolyl cis-trans isomerase
MRKQKSYALILIVILLAVQACNPKNKSDKTESETKKTDSVSFEKQVSERLDLSDKDSSETQAYYKVLKTGLKYHMHEYNPNRPYPNPGDVIYLRMDYFLHDSLLFSSSELPDTMKMRLTKPDLPGTIDEALFQMHENDSAEFVLDATKFYRHTRQLAELPHFIVPGDSLRFHIRLMKIIPSDKWIVMQEEKLTDKRQFEKSEIKQYLIKKALSPETLNGGVLREVTYEGNGPTVTENSIVSIHYEGRFLNDNLFSSTYEDKEVFKVNLGEQEIIPGLEIGLIGLNQGSTAKIIVPFELAYGEEQRGPVPPWSTLVFDVQVTSVQ